MKRDWSVVFRFFLAATLIIWVAGGIARWEHQLSHHHVGKEPDDGFYDWSDQEQVIEERCTWCDEPFFLDAEARCFFIRIQVPVSFLIPSPFYLDRVECPSYGFTQDRGPPFYV